MRIHVDAEQLLNKVFQGQRSLRHDTKARSSMGTCQGNVVGLPNFVPVLGSSGRNGSMPGMGERHVPTDHRRDRLPGSQAVTDAIILWVCVKEVEEVPC